MEYLAAWMFLALTILLLAGFPVAMTLLGTALIFGWIGFGGSLFDLLPLRIFGRITNVTLIAVPLFIFMGVMLERSGLAEDLLDTMGLMLGRLRGGLAPYRWSQWVRFSGLLQALSVLPLSPWVFLPSPP